MRKLMLMALAIFWLWATSGTSEAASDKSSHAILE